MCTQARLNLMHSQMFPLQWVAGHAAPSATEPPALAAEAPRNMTQFFLRPAAKIGTMAGEPLCVWLPCT